MASVDNRLTTDETRRIEEALRAEFPDAEAYRYNPASIRIRIIDDRFAGLSKVERHEMVMPLIRKLPDETREDITVLLLLTPDETEGSIMNLEFEHPSPSML